MTMKKIIITIVITFVSVTNVFSQELQVQDLKTRLNYYKTLCDKISENIDCVKRDEKNLNQKAKEDQQVSNLVKRITKQINDLSKRTEYLCRELYLCENRGEVHGCHEGHGADIVYESGRTDCYFPDG